MKIGYEIIYHFHERLETGYDKSVSKELKKKVGEPFEEVSLEKLAASVMGQLARRDIWVTDVEIYEYSKKKISFRETTGGIVIKNKKFTADGAVEIVGQELQVVEQPQIHPKKQAFHSNGRSNRPIRWVLFAPSEMKTVKEKQLRFTVEKKYPVFREDLHPSGVGMVLHTVDDLGRDQMVLDEYFIPVDQSLVMGRELGFNEKNSGDNGKLLWHGVLEDDMPSLR